MKTEGVYLAATIVISLILATRPRPSVTVSLQSPEPADVATAVETGPGPSCPDPAPAVANTQQQHYPIATDDPDKYRPTSSVKVLYFTASWCGPCKVSKPLVKEACTFCDAELIEVDFDKYNAYAKRWKVDRLPTTVITVDGKERWRSEQAISESPELATPILAARRVSGWDIDDLNEQIDTHARTVELRYRKTMKPGFDVTDHLVNDHGWPITTVEQLTEDRRHWLHDATHRGKILP